MSEQITTVKRNMGTCPSCSGEFVAEIDLIAETGKPYLNGTGIPTVTAQAHRAGLRLHHECGPEDQPGDFLSALIATFAGATPDQPATAPRPAEAEGGEAS